MQLTVDLYDVLNGQLLSDIEKSLYEQVMKHCRYNQSKAAKLLNISRGTLRSKLERYYGDTYCKHREPGTFANKPKC